MAPAFRIAHVDAERGFSGGEVQVFLLMEGLRRSGHQALLLCPPRSAGEAEARRRGIAVATVAMRGDADLVAVGRLAARLRGGVDLVHLHTGRAAWLGGLAARWAGLPAIVTRRMDRPVRRSWRTRLVYGRLTRRTVAISPGVADRLVAGGVPRHRITVIASAVDPARVGARRDRAALRAELGAAPGDCVVLVLAALERRKGIDVLLGALARLRGRGRRPPLWIAGDGGERAALTAQAAALGLAEQVRFLGRRADVGDLLAGCDVFALPSRREGLGVAALEAMAAARPVLASDVGGLGAAVVHGRTGLLVPPDDVERLADALAALAGDAELRARLAAEGPRRVAEGYLPEQMVAAYERVYAEVLGGAAPAR